MSDMIGKYVGDYQITALLGEGGMGMVFKGHHPTLGQIVAIKMLHPNLVKTAGIKDRFVREAQAMARLRHPNILQLYNFIENPDGCFIVMEFVEGETFEDLLERQGLIQPQQALEMFVPIMKAMAFAHKSNIVHRDIKPANLMRLHDGTCKVMDFGTAKVTDQAGLTAAGMTLGTVVYMSPEQLMGRDITPQADIYSLGVTLYEMVTGQLPFYDENEMALMKMIMKQPPPPPSQHYPAIPKSLEGAILKSMAKDRAQRFQTAEEFGATLERLLAEMTGGAGSGSAPVAAPVAAPAAPVATSGSSSGAVPVPAPVDSTQTMQRAAVATPAAGGGGLGTLGIVGIVLAAVGLVLVVVLAAIGQAVVGAIVGSVLILAGAGLLVAGVVGGKGAAAAAPPPPQIPPSAAPAGTKCLEFIDGPLRGQRQELAESSITVGRAPGNNLVIADPSVSSHHARFDFYQGKYFLSDLQSSNGTFVNNQRIEQVELKANDLVSMGASRIVVRI